MYKTDLFNYLSEIGCSKHELSPLGVWVDSEKLDDTPLVVREQIHTLIDTCMHPKLNVTSVNENNYTVTFDGEYKLQCEFMLDCGSDKLTAEKCYYRGKRISDCEVEVFGNLVSIINEYDNVIAIFCLKGVIEK